MTRKHPSGLLIGLAFAAVYVIWGSTYLGIRLAIETIPPLAMAGVRFLLAGLLLFPFALLSGRRTGERLTRIHWRSALIIGILLLGIGNGGVTFGEQYVPSGVVALLIASVPLWMAVFAHIRGVERISRVGIAGLVVGFLGVGLLLRPGASGTASVGWILFVLCAPIGWAFGSLYARSAAMPRLPLLGVAMEMICGGSVLCLVATFHGEWAHLNLAAVSLTSSLAFIYLVLFGSMIAYTAYVFLLGSVSPGAVSSYAYVNPLVAVLLGWAFLGEPITALTLAAGGLVVVAVAMLVLGRSRARGSGAAAPAGLEIA